MKKYKIGLDQFSRDLKEARKSAGLTQRQLATACQYADNTLISRMEGGGRYPTDDALRHLFANLPLLVEKYPELAKELEPYHQAIVHETETEKPEEIWVVSQTLDLSCWGQQEMLKKLEQVPHFFVIPPSTKKRAEYLMEKNQSTKGTSLSFSIVKKELIALAIFDLVIQVSKNYDQMSAYLLIEGKKSILLPAKTMLLGMEQFLDLFTLVADRIESTPNLLPRRPGWL